MTDDQARIADWLRTQRIAATATEVAQAMARPRDAVLDDLRALEDAGQVCGGEAGYYRTANTLRRDRVRA